MHPVAITAALLSLASIAGAVLELVSVAACVCTGLAGIAFALLALREGR